MGMEDETLTLILEFLLRQPIPNRTLSVLVSTLPLPRTLSLHLLHSILLRHLTFPFSDKTLTSLELLHQFHNNCKSLQTAYSAVAVYLTVRILQKEDVAEFVKAVECIWRKRIGDLEMGGERGLVAEGLRRERRTMEKALGSELVREELMRRDVSKMATEAVETFLKEAVEGLGLTGLKVAAEVVRQREARVKGKRKLEVPAEKSKISNIGECSGSGFDYILNQKVIQEKHPEEQGFRNDYAMANEPLPAYTDVAEKYFPTTSEVPCQAGRNEEPNLNDDPNTTNTRDGHNNIHIDVPSCRNKRLYSHDIGKKPSIMERNPTARTHQWHDDSSNSSLEEESPISKKKHCKRPQLERKIPSTFLLPLDISVGGPVKKEWTPDEEDSLRKAVTELGTSNWNLIRSTYPEFQSRTLEGLRNKWRHMNRKLGLKKM